MFTDNALALIDSDAGGGGNFGGEPSPDTTMYFSVGTSAGINIAAGFDGTGSVLATLELPITPIDGGDPNGLFSPFYPIGVSFSGIAHSIVFSGVQNQIGFDDITFGSAVAGEIREVLNGAYRTNNAKRNMWMLDPDGLLGENPEFTVIGTMPRTLRIEGRYLVGVIPETGVYAFTIVATDDHRKVRTEFAIEVFEATLCPVFTGVVINGVSYPTVIQTAPTHGTPAITELVNIIVPANQALSIGLEWDWIKGDCYYKLIRGTLPAGMTLDEVTGITSGIPIETGEYIFVVSVKDWRGRAFQWIRLVVQ